MPKCAICKKELNQKFAHRKKLGVNKAGRDICRYYCSKEEYETHLRIKEEIELKKEKDRRDKDAVYEEIRVKYFPATQMISSLPRLIFIDIGGISNIHTWEQILDYLHDDEEYLTNAMKKDFPSYDVRAKYFAKTVLNRIDGKRVGFNKQSEVQAPVIKQTEDSFIAPSFTPKKQKTDTRKGFDDLLEDL